MFKEILDSYDKLSISNKREEINDELLYLFLLFEGLCASKNIQYRKILDTDIKELISETETEDEFLNNIYVYIQTIKERIGSILEEQGDNYD